MRKRYSKIGQRFNVHRKTVARHIKLYRRNTERSETIP